MTELEAYGQLQDIKYSLIDLIESGDLDIDLIREDILEIIEGGSGNEMGKD